MFDRFGDYMYSLLPSPLKKGKESANQFYLFFAVIGRQFDQVKTAILRLRQEANILTASAAMLPVHGADREMPRLAGESIDGYRRRLIMKRQIAQAGGTDQAFAYLAQAFGYAGAEKERSADPAKWAELTLRLYGGQIVLENRDLLFAELKLVKAAGAKIDLRTEQRFEAIIYVAGCMQRAKFVEIRQG
ncbi:MAG: hypothetical protein VB085_13470 [Peptococcaceae bacterium]|nr:hypothetical protein [Peptococcaceae bacterium]